MLTMILEPGRSFNLVIINSLRAAGDVKFPVYIGIASMWGVSVPLAYVLGIQLDLGLVGIWLAFTADEWLRGLLALPGKPVLATHLRTHTQVLDERVALLAPPHPEAFAEGLVRLLRDAALRERLGQAGRALVASKYNHRTYEATVDDLLERLAAVVGPGESLAANSQS